MTCPRLSLAPGHLALRVHIWPWVPVTFAFSASLPRVHLSSGRSCLSLSLLPQPLQLALVCAGVSLGPFTICAVRAQSPITEGLTQTRVGRCHQM